MSLRGSKWLPWSQHQSFWKQLPHSHHFKLYGTNEWKTTIGKNLQALDAIIKFGSAQQQKPAAATPENNRLGSSIDQINVTESVLVGILCSIMIEIAKVFFCQESFPSK